jgi:hypothetical protein
MAVHPQPAATKLNQMGRIGQCVRSEFKLKPTAGFEDQWLFIRSQLLQS